MHCEYGKEGILGVVLNAVGHGSQSYSLIINEWFGSCLGYLSEQIQSKNDPSILSYLKKT